MDACPSTQAQSPARRAPREPLGAAASVRLRATLEVLILSLLAALLGRRHASWHHAPAPFCEEHPLPRPGAPAPLRARTPHDGTHLVCESPLLYLIGPGPNRGLNPRPRAMPLARARIARAPPRPQIPPKTPIRAKSPPTGGRSRTPRA